MIVNFELSGYHILFPQMPWYAIIVFACLILLFFRKAKRNKHKANIKIANKALDTLQSITTPAVKYGYLRKIDPYIFEEMILTAIARKGQKIRRNKRYSGDGGIDGKAIIDGKEYLIQAKRYKSYIDNKHVEAFALICNRRNKKGLFVHTGKTGPKSRVVASQHNKIKIISGKNLLDLLSNNQHFYIF